MTPTSPTPRRSALFMPGSNPRALAKARSLDADVIIMDLEDAVAPEAKARARSTAVAAIAEGGYGGREVVVRINHVDSPWFDEDVMAVAGTAPDAVLAPKVESAEQVHRVLAAMQRAGASPGLELWVMIETPLGVLQAPGICTAHTRLACLVAGTSDLAQTLRVPPTSDRAGLVPALTTCVLAARAAGLDALDGVQLDIEDDDALAAVCAQGRRLGFDGKTLIHPRQIPACNAAFGPAHAEIEAARRVVDAYASARREGAGVAVVDGRLVENLHVTEAERTLALADAIERRRLG